MVKLSVFVTIWFGVYHVTLLTRKEKGRTCFGGILNENGVLNSIMSTIDVD